MTALAEQRKVVTCDQCRLVQFMTASTLCRRCHIGLVPEEPEAIATLPAPLALVPITQSADFSHIGATVREIRLRRHMAQSELATRVGVFRTWISKVEGAKVIPTIASLTKIAKALDVDISTLLCEPETRIANDPFLSELAGYVSQLDGGARTLILNTIRELAAAR